MKRTLVLALAACGSTASEDPRPDWDEVQSNCGSLTLRFPGSFTATREQGEDSCVESYTFATCDMQLDYGGFSDRLTSYDGEQDYTSSDERIGGERAKVVRFRCGTLHCAGLNLPTEREQLSATLFARCQSADDQQTALAVMRTLRLD